MIIIQNKLMQLWLMEKSIAYCESFWMNSTFSNVMLHEFIFPEKTVNWPISVALKLLY
jgi:hypothetical protein